MNRGRAGAALVGLVLAACAGAQAQNVVETRLPAAAAAPAVGSGYREQVDRATRAILTGDVEAAMPALRQAVAYCDRQLARPGLRFVSVGTAREYERYAATHPAATPLEWLDMACPRAYHMTGYVLAGQGRHAEALPWLDKAIALAPYFPDPANERAAALNRLGQLDEAIAGYRQVLELARADPGAAYIAPLAWRGIGWALAEKRDWGAARTAYETSLRLDPGNALARSELDYIARQADASPP